MNIEEPIAGASIYRKIKAVYDDVTYIRKDKKNAFHNYTYASEAAIKDHLHEAFAKHGLVMLPPEMVSIHDVEQTTEKGKRETVTTIQVRFGIADTESGESVSGTVYGRGVDSSDKGVYKAITGGLKYFLTTTFLIPTGDDPEEEPKYVPKQEAKAAAKRPEPNPRTGNSVPTAFDRDKFQGLIKDARVKLGDSIYWKIMGANGFTDVSDVKDRSQADGLWSDFKSQLDIMKQRQLEVSAGDIPEATRA